jgi:hypothetical protein
MAQEAAVSRDAGNPLFCDWQVAMAYADRLASVLLA